MKMSWLKNGISTSACARLNWMAVDRLPFATGTPTRVAKYSARPGEIVAKHKKFAVAGIWERKALRVEIDHSSSGGAKCRHRLIEGINDGLRRGVGRIGSLDACAGQPYPCTFQPVRIKELSVIGRNERTRLPEPSPAERNAAGRGIAPIKSAALNHAKGDGAVATVRP